MEVAKGKGMLHREHSRQIPEDVDPHMAVGRSWRTLTLDEAPLRVRASIAAHKGTAIYSVSQIAPKMLVEDSHESRQQPKAIRYLPRPTDLALPKRSDPDQVRPIKKTGSSKVQKLGIAIISPQDYDFDSQRFVWLSTRCRRCSLGLAASS